MKIALIPSPLDSTLMTAIGLGALHTAKRLGKTDEVIVYTGGGKGIFSAQTAFEDGISFRRLSVGPDRLTKRFLQRLPFLFKKNRPFFSSPLYYPLYGAALAKDIASNGFDIAHVNNFSQFVPFIRPKNRKAKIVLHMHCEWLTQLDPTMIRKRLSKTSLVLGCSDFITSKIKAGFPEYSGSCRTLHNGVDTSFFDLKRKGDAAGPKRVLFIGRISPEKGVHVLADAFKLAAQAVPDIRLDIVGQVRPTPPEFLASLSDDPMIGGLKKFYTGDYVDEIRKRIGPGLIDRVKFHGHVAHDKIQGFLEKADLVVNTSLYETFGVPVAEAMACGIPVVAVDAGGVPEVVSNAETGLLARRGDAKAVAEAMVAILRNGDLAHRMGEAGKKRALELFSWDNIAVKLRGFYEELLGGDAPACLEANGPPA